MAKKIKLSELIPNDKNPRFIKDGKFKKLLNSIKQSPSFMDMNPIKVDEDMVILGGNMRYRACKDLKWKEVPYEIFTKEMAEKNNIEREKQGIETATYKQQCNEYIIKDNIGYGEWDWDILANEWDNTQLDEWALDVWQPEEDVDYSILDDEGFSDDLEDMKNGVKKALQIPFELEHYDEAFELVKYWREQGAYVGMMLIEKLKIEKQKQDEKN